MCCSMETGRAQSEAAWKDDVLQVAEMHVDSQPSICLSAGPSVPLVYSQRLGSDNAESQCCRHPVASLTSKSDPRVCWKFGALAWDLWKTAGWGAARAGQQLCQGEEGMFCILSSSENWRSYSGQQNMPFWNCPAETSLPFSEGADSFMFGFEKIHVALVLGRLLQASAERQLVSIELFSSMTFAEAWISQAADVQWVLPDRLSITVIFLILPSVPDYCVFFNIKIVRAYREGDVILLFVLLFGLRINLALCGPRLG